MPNRPTLNEISISGIGVIEKSLLEFGPGLTVITGETGAGKTMVLTALNLVLGGKSDSALVRHGAERAIANATFTIPKKLVDGFDEKGIISEDGELILTRTVNKDGKSKAIASGTAVSASALQEIAEELVMVHSQAASQTMTKSSKHLELLDLYANIDLSKLQSAVTEANELSKRIKAMKSAGKERERELEALKEFASALKKIKPQAGELQEVNDEISKLNSVEGLTSTAGSASGILEDDENGVLTQLGSARKSLEKAVSLDPSLTEISEQLNEAFFEVQDLAANLASYLSDLAADPSRLEYLQNRKSELNSFIKRHSKSTSGDSNQALHELIELGANIDNEIADLEGGDDRIAELERDLDKLQEAALVEAKQISKIRNEKAKSLSVAVSHEIHSLSMPSTNLVVEVKNGSKFTELTATGLDEVNFFLQTHKDAPLVSIAKGASGGELSRVALAIEVVIAASEQNETIGTYIFDEVDAGVGGKAAIEVGRRLKALSKIAQVIVVTHLPQVAAWGDTHFVVSKDESGSVSLSQVRKVSTNERIEEIARMLAGHEDSESARKHAEELIAESR
ncbi:MAG: DNA repair protein RecN [Candidatus Nanopelagicaceae bacterium]|nr:DNA repair protein RecN [Candidatus Nanopelagicaceae bacterium]